MKNKMRFQTSVLPATLILLTLLRGGVDSASAQDYSEAAVHAGESAAISRKIRPAQRAVHLSTAGNNLLYLTDSGALNRVNSSPAAQQAIRRLLANKPLRTAATNSNPIRVSDPDFDFLLSRLAGFTQNGSSNAWCGQNIVVGYNDSAALLLTSALGTSFSFSGVAVSHDGGTSFQASLFLDAGSDPANFLAGEPVIACSGNSFYYASLFEFPGPIDPTTGVPIPFNGVAVNRSRNSGDAWSAPVAAVKKNATEHIVDKEWLTVDPNNPDKLYASYTDFDFSFAKGNGCNGGVRVAIELVTSNNSGIGWTRPVTVDQLCNPAFGQALQGSQVVIGNSGEIYVAWVAETNTDEQVVFGSSSDGGMTFSHPITVGSAVLAGLGGNGRLQGLIGGNSFPSMSVDRSKGASRGTLYLAWTDASGNQIPDFLARTGSYGFGDVVLSRSTDKGRNWTPAQVVSPAPPIFSGSGRDQFLPSVAVDHEGTLAVCYFDRRRDLQNNGVDHYCSISHNQGASFLTIRNTNRLSAPTHSTDGLMDPVSFGDYDGVSSDASGASPGFFSTFQTQVSGNPDIVGVRF
jgi:hypothetical protein